VQDMMSISYFLMMTIVFFHCHYYWETMWFPHYTLL